MCARILYETGANTYIADRSLDWNDVNMESDFWIFPRDLKRDGGVGPGTITAADRFVRASYALKSSPKFKDRRAALAAVLSQMRSIGVPLGMSDPDKPNISSTLWRTVIDHDAKRCYFDAVINPSVIWVDLEKVDLKPGAKPMKLQIGVPEIMGGEVSTTFKPGEPFKFMRRLAPASDAGGYLNHLAPSCG